MTWKLAPALAAGCTFVVKPSEHSPASTLGFAAADRRGRLPARRGQRRHRARPGRPGAALAAHPGVDKIAFTGSTATGRAVAHAAAENLNRVTLELGGKSPQVVFPDADLEAAANGIIAGVFAATGQTCMAGSRLIVHATCTTSWSALVAERADAIKLGDPNDPETEMGPVANGRSTRRCSATSTRPRPKAPRSPAAAQRTPSWAGCSSQPDACSPASPPESTVVREEVFGPVLAALTFPTEEEALKIANDTPYGLAGAVWTQGRAPRAPGRRAAPGRHRLDQRLPGRRRRTRPFGGFGPAGWAGRTAPTRCTSTPRSSPSGSS